MLRALALDCEVHVVHVMQRERHAVQREYLSGKAVVVLSVTVAARLVLVAHLADA